MFLSQSQCEEYKTGCAEFLNVLDTTFPEGNPLRPNCSSKGKSYCRVSSIHFLSLCFFLLSSLPSAGTFVKASYKCGVLQAPALDDFPVSSTLLGNADLPLSTQCNFFTQADMQSMYVNVQCP